MVKKSVWENTKQKNIYTVAKVKTKTTKSCRDKEEIKKSYDDTMLQNLEDVQAKWKKYCEWLLTLDWMEDYLKRMSMQVWKLYMKLKGRIRTIKEQTEYLRMQNKHLEMKAQTLWNLMGKKIGHEFVLKNKEDTKLTI